MANLALSHPNCCQNNHGSYSLRISHLLVQALNEYYLFNPTANCCKVDATVPITQVRKVRHREFNYVALNPTTCKLETRIRIITGPWDFYLLDLREVKFTTPKSLVNPSQILPPPACPGLPTGGVVLLGELVGPVQALIEPRAAELDLSVRGGTAPEMGKLSPELCLSDNTCSLQAEPISACSSQGGA